MLVKVEKSSTYLFYFLDWVVAMVVVRDAAVAVDPLAAARWVDAEIPDAWILPELLWKEVAEELGAFPSAPVPLFIVIEHKFSS